jgi:chromosome segregation ATPase
MTSYDASINIDGGASVGDIGELSARVDLLAGQVKREADLCASRDHDLSNVSEKLRGQERLLQAIGITQSEHTAALRRLSFNVETLDTRFLTLEVRFESLETHFRDLESRFGAVETKVGAMESRFGAVETKVEAMESRFGAVEAKVGAIETGHGALLAQILSKLDQLTGESPSPNEASTRC